MLTFYEVLACYSCNKDEFAGRIWKDTGPWDHHAGDLGERKVLLSTVRKKSTFFAQLQDLCRSAFPHFGWGWVALLGVVLLDSIWLSRTWLTVLYPPWIAFLPLLILVGIKILYHLFSSRGLPVLRDFFPVLNKDSLGDKLSLAAEYIALSLSTAFALCILSYLVCTLPYPLIDRPLNEFDHYIGFDWQYWYRWSQNPANFFILLFAYNCIAYQFLVFAIWFAVSLCKDRLYETYWILSVALVLAIVISGFWPSLGPASLLNWPQAELGKMQHQFGRAMAGVMAIRSHIAPDLTAQRLDGIVTFPSFHTACALIYCYAFRRTTIARYILFLNILMLLSIPFIGNHYIADMIGGGIIAVISIALVRSFYRVKI